MKIKLARYGLCLLTLIGICLTMSDSAWFPLVNLSGLFIMGIGMLGVWALE